MQETIQLNVFHFVWFVPAPPWASHVTLDKCLNLVRYSGPHLLYGDADSIYIRRWR